MISVLPPLVLGAALIALLTLPDQPAVPVPLPTFDIPTHRHSATGLDDWADIAAVVRPRLSAELRAQGFEPGAAVFIRIMKQSRELQVFLKDGATYRHFRTYPICAFSGGLGPKLAEGDMQAPEGFYTVSRGQMNPNSKFHLSFNLGYPNEFDRSYGRTGSALMVHGNCVSIGCYAMTDAGIEEIYTLVDLAHAKGQKTVPVHAFPFRMTQPMLEDEDNLAFWENLREGYLAFEATKNPPLVSARGGRYVFRPRS